jgi:hypothetical protein
MLTVGLVIVPVVGLLVWVWRTVAQVHEAMRSFNGFEGMHCED